MKKVDTKEFELPRTHFCSDIENRVFQVITLQALGKVSGVSLIDGNLIDALFGKEAEKTKGIHIEQHPETNEVKVRVELNIDYGVSIPEKAEEVQSIIVEEIARYTGLHVASVHVVVKGLSIHASV